MGLKNKMPKLVLSLILILLGLILVITLIKVYSLKYINGRWTSYNVNLYNFKCFNSFKIFTKFSKYEKKTSIFSAAPGALGPLMILAEDEKN